MPNIQAILFDWGNTIVDYPLFSEDAQVSFLKDFLVRNNICPEEYLSVHNLRAFNNENADNSFTALRMRVERLLALAISEEKSAQIESLLCQEIFQRGALYPDADLCVRQLEAAGFKLGVVSNTPWGTSAKLWGGELRRYFPNTVIQVVFCEDVGFRKPDGRGLHRCCDLMGVRPNQAIFVGDSITSDVPAAIAVGCFPVLLDRRKNIAQGVAVNYQQISSLDEVMSMTVLKNY